MEYFNSIYDIAVAQIEKDLTIGYIENVAFIEKIKTILRKLFKH